MRRPTKLAPSLAYLMGQAIKWNLYKRGILIPNDLETPDAGLPFSISNGSNNEHRCRAGVIEEFEDGVPVFREFSVPKEGGGLLKVSRPEPYWSGKIRLYHEADVPDSSWRRLHLLEAMSFLGLYPSFGAVRYKLGDETWELFITPDGKMKTWRGLTHEGHHAAYTTMLCPGCVIEQHC